jgi:hypothetical protein
MPLNSSGPISLGGATSGESINLEIGVSATATVSLNDTNVRTLAGSSFSTPGTQISVPTDFYGKSLVTTTPVYYYVAANGIYTPPGSPSQNKQLQGYNPSHVGWAFIGASKIHACYKGQSSIGATTCGVIHMTEYNKATGQRTLITGWGNMTQNHDWNMVCRSQDGRYMYGTGNFVTQFGGPTSNNANFYGKYDTQTNSWVWMRSYHTATSAALNGFRRLAGLGVELSNGNVVLITNKTGQAANVDRDGFMIINGSTSADIFTTKYTSAGTPGTFLSIVKDSSDNFYILTSSSYILKYNSSGTLLWTQQYTSDIGTLVGSQPTLLMDPSDNLYCFVDHALTVVPLYSYPETVMNYAFKMNSSGTILWSSKWNGAWYGRQTRSFGTVGFKWNSAENNLIIVGTVLTYPQTSAGNSVFTWINSSTGLAVRARKLTYNSYYPNGNLTSPQYEGAGRWATAFDVKDGEMLAWTDQPLQAGTYRNTPGLSWILLSSTGGNTKTSGYGNSTVYQADTTPTVTSNVITSTAITPAYSQVTGGNTLNAITVRTMPGPNYQELPILATGYGNW